jgi:hypothetical protein
VFGVGTAGRVHSSSRAFCASALVVLGCVGDGSGRGYTQGFFICPFSHMSYMLINTYIQIDRYGRAHYIILFHFTILSHFPSPFPIPNLNSKPPHRSPFPLHPSPPKLLRKTPHAIDVLIPLLLLQRLIRIVLFDLVNAVDDAVQQRYQLVADECGAVLLDEVAAPDGC